MNGGKIDDVYIKNSNNKWWDGYRGQTCVILDELGDKQINLTYLLRWFDKYPCTVETKGATLPLKATSFIVTSNLTIDECWPEANLRHLEAMKRRCHVTHFNIVFQ